ncbi:SDR family oxidoreductase [Williamsia sp.]|uniref:SDR family oxidoreductase n=1 Tax=Williamsia sp. TaxID=1872085 RepID=UPI001A30919D|nr:SDR family oxidoreductase [Williamsia sp.]MBJ7291729.1 SDR family oxidoreductase [Williamsia sp.]
MTTLTPAAAIVTGGSRSIGRAISERLARDGHPVLVNYAHGASDADETVRSIVDAGGRAIAARGDVASAADVERLFANARAEFGAVGILVNNAGVSVLGELSELDDDAYDRVFDVSARGTYNGLRVAAGHLADGGRIVNLSSTAIAITTPRMGVYLAAKAAVETFTRVAAKELAPRGITVNAVAPGLVRSEMFADGKTPEQLASIEKASPAGRLGEVSEIADAVALLTSPEASWISGQIIRVNGGVA